ncbi:MAG: hypothetical protein H7Y17_06830 [Chlorobia bacterium]|nr:hypothetical protein [Fimbriimonadaceae bacterium]
MPDDYERRREFNDRQDRDYQNFRSDLEYDRQVRIADSDRGWIAHRQGDTLGAIAGFAGVDAALAYARSMDASEEASRLGYALDWVELFEGPHNCPIPGTIDFTSIFERAHTRFIYVLPTIRNPYDFIKTFVTVTAKIRTGSEEPFSSYDNPFPVYENTKNFRPSFFYGWHEPGNWETGEYTVEFFVNGESIGERMFLMTEY